MNTTLVRLGWLALYAQDALLWLALLGSLYGLLRYAKAAR